MVAGTGQNDLKGFFFGLGLDQLLVHVQALHILQLQDIFEIHIGGADLLSLEHKRRAAQGKLDQSQQLGQGLTHRRIWIDLGHHAGIVVIVVEQGHPAVIAVAAGPLHIVVFQVIQIVAIIIKANLARILQMIKGEDHIHLSAVITGEHAAHLQTDAGALAYGERIVRRKGLAAQLAHKLMKSGAIEIVLDTVVAHELAYVLVALRDLRNFRNIVNHVHTETIHTLFQPPADHGADIGTHGRALPVQIHLF